MNMMTNTALSNPALTQRFNELGIAVAKNSTPEATDAFVAAEMAVPQGLFPREWWVAICAAAAALAMIWRARLWPLTQLAIVAVVGIILTSYPGVGPRSLLPGSPGYEARRGVLDALAPRLSSQERVYPMGRSGFVVDFSLIPKLASLYRIRSATDYEPLLSARYA